MWLFKTAIWETLSHQFGAQHGLYKNSPISDSSRRLWLSEIPCWKSFPANFDAAGKFSLIFRQHEMLWLPRFRHFPARKMAAGRSAPPSVTLLDFLLWDCRSLLEFLWPFFKGGERKQCTNGALCFEPPYHAGLEVSETASAKTVSAKRVRIDDVADIEIPYRLPFWREFCWVLQVCVASGVDTEFPYRARIVDRGGRDPYRARIVDRGGRGLVCRHRFRFPDGPMKLYSNPTQEVVPDNFSVAILYQHGPKE